jgi:hypothetical protein
MAWRSCNLRSEEVGHSPRNATRNASFQVNRYDVPSSAFITHPDYLIERRARNVYESLLDYLRQTVARERIWAALPGDVDQWWRARSQIKLASRRNDWEIVGPGKERARLAYVVLDGGRLVYELAQVPSRASAAR